MEQNRRKYRREIIDEKVECDPESFRVIPAGAEGKKLLLCCPKGYWDSKKKKCLVGMKAVSKLVPIEPNIRRDNMRRARRLNPCYRRNVEYGFRDVEGRFHPIRASLDYEPERVGEKYAYASEEKWKEARKRLADYWKKRGKEIRAERIKKTKKKAVKAKTAKAKEVKPEVAKTEGKKAIMKWSPKTKKLEKLKKNIPLYIANRPVKPVVEIYPKVEKIFAEKTKGSNKGKYYHTFGKGVKAYGLSDGSVLLTHKKIKI